MSSAGVLEGEDLGDAVRDVVKQTVQKRVDDYGDPELPARWAEQVMWRADRGRTRGSWPSGGHRGARRLRSAGIEHALPTEQAPAPRPSTGARRSRRPAGRSGCAATAALDEAVPGLAALVDLHELTEGGPEDHAEMLKARAEQLYDQKETAVGSELMRQIERSWLLRIIDMRWMQHLKDMDFLREAIYLRAYGQRDPLLEYTREAHTLFQDAPAGHLRGYDEGGAADRGRRRAA